VDYDPVLRELLALILERAGHRTASAADSAAGAQCLEQTTFDLVITDMHMPDRDGLEFIADLRRRFPGVRIPAMSGGGHISGENYLRMARGLGAHGVLEKTFTQKAMFAAAALDAGTSAPIS